MISVEKVKAVLREVYKKRGYIVIGTAGTFRLGDVTTKLFQYEIGSKFVVSEKTDAADWKGQSNLIAEIKPEWIRYPDPSEGSFYRVIPEEKKEINKAEKSMELHA